MNIAPRICDSSSAVAYITHLAQMFDLRVLIVVKRVMRQTSFTFYFKMSFRHETDIVQSS